MAKKTKYFFDPQTLTYVIVHRNWRKIILRTFGFLCASVVFGGIIMVGAYTYLDSPKEKILKNEIESYKLQMQLYDRSIGELTNSLQELIQRDTQIYRVVFEAAPLPDSSELQKKMFLQKYKELEGLTKDEDVQRVSNRITQLSAKMQNQKKSFEDILLRAQRKQDMLASIPAIQPIENKQLSRVASGFGYRIHPIYKTRKMHTGMDFTAPKGTAVYATGNGTVTFAGYNEGYGYHIIINHGYGYETLYAHLSDMDMRVGQAISRGQKVGEVGSSGLSTSPHLHYEVIKNGNKINPVHFYYSDLSAADYEKIKEIAASNNQSFD